MTKAEMQSFVKRIKAYYPIFSLDKDSMDVWYEKLKDYEQKDLLEKFEEHLKGEYALEPPKLHFLTKYLKTKEQKEKATNDYLIRCNLCGQEMYLSDYDNTHYKKCLLIKTLIPILKKRGEDVNYEILDEYDYETLDKVYMKYVPEVKKDYKKLFTNSIK